MSSRARKPVYTPNVSDSKLAMIRSGKKKKTVTGFKENKKKMIKMKENLLDF